MVKEIEGRLLVGLLVGLVAIMVLHAPLAGQQFSIAGQVYDATSGDRGVPDARIRLESHGTTVSGPDGSFSFSRVRPGDHRLTVEAFGYQDLAMSVDLVSDTTLVLELIPSPIGLDTVDVVLSTIDLDARVRDPRTDAWVPDAEVYSDQGHHEKTNLFGRFSMDDVFRGPLLHVTIRAFRYLPLDTALSTEDEGPHTLNLARDPVMGRMLAAYRERLEDRAHGLIYNEGALNRADMAQYAPNTSLRRIMEVTYPSHIVQRIRCFFLDETEYRFTSEAEWISVWEGTLANDIERIELLEIPGHGRLLMARVYTRHFFQRHVPRPGRLDRPMMIETPGGLVCR